jgi:hypothetical protein
VVIYRTLDGRTFDLGKLSAAEQAFFRRCEAAYRDGMNWGEFLALVGSQENPLLRPTQGWVTPAVWRHPLYRAVRDLGDRLGIQQGILVPGPKDAIHRAPLSDIRPSLSVAAKAS